MNSDTGTTSDNQPLPWDFLMVTRLVTRSLAVMAIFLAAYLGLGLVCTLYYLGADAGRKQPAETLLQKLEPGMTQGEVEKWIGRAPDYTTRSGDLQEECLKQNWTVNGCRLVIVFKGGRYTSGYVFRAERDDSVSTSLAWLFYWWLPKED